MTRGDGGGTLSTSQAELQMMLAEAQEQLLARDDAIRSLRSEEFAHLKDVIARQDEAIRWLEGLVAHRDSEIEWLRGVVAEKDRETTWLRESVDSRLREQDQTLRAVQSTRLFRLGQRYWRLRDRLRRRPTLGR